MSKQLLRIQGLKGIRDFTRDVSLAHLAVQQFKSGLNLLDDSTESNYPLAFLESDFNSSTQGTKETYSISLNIADYLPNDASEEDVIDGMSKTEQILSEIHYAMTQVASNVLISEINKTSFRDYDSDNLVVTRGEFTITTPRFTARSSTPVDKLSIQDNKAIRPVTLYKPDGTKLELNSGAIYYLPSFQENSMTLTLMTNTPYVLSHNLNSENILVTFLFDSLQYIADYSIIDNNTIQITSAVDIYNLQVIVQVADFTTMVAMVAGVGNTITHNLNSTQIDVQFYIDNTGVIGQYTIVDANTILVTSDIPITALKVVIEKQ
jgi:hypothetical protein